MIQPPFPSTMGTQPRHDTFLITKTAVNQEHDGQTYCKAELDHVHEGTGSPCLDKPVLAQGDGACLLCLA